MTANEVLLLKASYDLALGYLGAALRRCCGQHPVYPRLQEAETNDLRHKGRHLHVCKCTVPSKVREASF